MSRCRARATSNSALGLLVERDEEPAAADWRLLESLPGPDDPPRMGICCSGGGVRSASFNLGALQALRTGDVLPSAAYVAGVSGGGYITLSHALARKLSDPACETTKNPLYGRLSPEEEYLRRNSDYLAPGTQGRVWFGLHLLGGFP